MKLGIKFAWSVAGISSFCVEKLIWDEYGKAIKSDYPLDVSFFYMYEKKHFRKQKLYLCLVSSRPGSLIGKAGTKIYSFKEKLITKYPFINDVKIIESTMAKRDPADYAYYTED